MLQATILFLLAGVAEVGGGYLIWLWLREGKSYWVGGLGAIILALYGVIATLYGGVFILISVLWDGELTKKPIVMTGLGRLSV